MESIIRKAICAVEARHNVQVLNGDLRPTFADAIEYRHHHKTVPLFIDIQSEVAVIGARNCADGRIRLEVPRFVRITRPIEDFYERCVFVEFLIQIEEGPASNFLVWKAPADIHDSPYYRDVAGRKVHAD